MHWESLISIYVVKKTTDLKYSVKQIKNIWDVINSDSALRFERKSNYDYDDYFYSFPLFVSPQKLTMSLKSN